MENNYLIGKVISVAGDRIEVGLLESKKEGEENIGVPESMCVHIDTAKGPEPILIGQPGSFILVNISTGLLLSMVVDIHMKESVLTATEIKKAGDSEEYPLESSKRIISAIAVGTTDGEGNFERGTDVLPTVNNDVFAVQSSLINKIYESFAEGNFSLGKLSLLPQQEAKINFDSFLSRHVAILGQTGSGKSWTVASLLQKISDFKKATVVLFDLHGEYKSAFKKDFEFIDASNLEFPYWLMNFEELQDLMVDRSESTAPNQVAKFKDLLQKAKESHPENQALEIPKITVDTPVYFDFKNIIGEFEQLDKEMVPGKTGKPKQGDFYGQFSRLLIRINSRLNDKRYDLIFEPKKYNTSASMENLFRKILGEEKEKPKKLVIIDMSPIPFDVRGSVISLALRCLFDFSYWYKRLHGKSYPVSVFCDEAHLYLNDRVSSNESARLSAERIAKEGRKYGISLSVISQRPREVSATILSQCNSFVCLRITNPEDQSYVKSLLPDSIRGIVNIFSTLRRGEAILLGDSIIMPTRIKIDPPDPQPDSDDTSFYREWNLCHTEIKIEDVLHAWRKQEI